jgi:hypothetical protein
MSNTSGSDKTKILRRSKPSEFSLSEEDVMILINAINETLQMFDDEVELEIRFGTEPAKAKALRARLQTEALRLERGKA